MYFSATASFSAGAVLLVIGVSTIKKVKHSSEIMFASIPVIFAIQQIAEGILWLTLTKANMPSLQNSMTYLYLIIDQIVWPVWIPLSIFFLEKNQLQKRIQKILIITGGLVSLYMMYCIFNFTVNSKIDNYHIRYIQDYPVIFSLLGSSLYIIATIGPPFFSSLKHMWLLSTSILLSYIISIIFYEEYLISVWCFFASIISISVYFIMQEINNLCVNEMLHEIQSQKFHKSHTTIKLS